MSSSESIVCKPTPWFLLRALVMLLMFGVFAVLFYIDGSTGYRKKNEAYFMKKAFEFANAEFTRMNTGGLMAPESWEKYASEQNVAFSEKEFPENPAVLPANLKLPMPWPPVLHDFDRMKPLQWNILWREYSKERGLNASVDEPYSDQKIKEQWIVFAVCAVLALIAAFFLLRTVNRSISADDEAITDQKGKRIPYVDLKSLDLRKWDTKGLAFIDYDGASGKGRIRIDGLTYGGFKKENDEPAERLMRRIRSRFSGEIIEYAPVGDPESKDDESTPA